MDALSLCTGGESDLVPGRLRGYRCWNFRDADELPTLTALNHQYGAWSERMRAVCLAPRTIGDPAITELPRDEHPAPYRGCGCGLWGWYRPDETRLTQGIVFGAVDASGRTLLGDYGFRAEKARIVALAYDGPQRVRDGLRRRYDVPVFTDPEHLAAHFPPDDVRSLVPTAFISEPAMSGYVNRTQLFRSGVDPYLHPELELDDEPVWHYQLHSIMNSNFLFARDPGGLQIELISRFTEHRVLTQDPRIISLYVTSPIAPVDELFWGYARQRRSAMLTAPLFSASDDEAEQPPPAAEPPSREQAALELRRQRPTGPRRNPFSRLGRR